MKRLRRTISILLTLTMALTLLSGPALGAGLPTEVNASADGITWSYNTLDGRVIDQDTYAGKIQVLVYFNITGGCSNSNRTINGIASSRWISNSDVQVIAVGCYGYAGGQRVTPDEERMRTYADVYASSNPNIVFAWSYDPLRAGHTEAIEYLQAAGLKSSGDNSILYATTVVLDEDGRIRYGWSGKYNESYYSGVMDALGQGSGGDEGGSQPPASSGIQLTYDSSISDQEWQVLRLVNQHRMEMGLEPLSTNDQMQQVGNQRAEELITDYHSDHSRPDGSECFTVLDDYRVSGYYTAAENIAYGYRSPSEVMNGWLNSSGHRKNIENSALTHLGVGCAGSSTLYWAQHFIGGSCSYRSISLSRSSISAAGQDLEQALEQADITVTATCSVHGSCKLPLIAAMCSGYDPASFGDQDVTVTLGGAATTLKIKGSCSHQFGPDVVEEATCVREGSRLRVCTLCGYREQTTIPKIDHQYDQGVVTREPTSQQEGVKTYTCTLCGQTRQESIPKTECQHAFGAWTVTKKATCTQTGTRQCVCTLCGESKTEQLPVISHQPDAQGICTLCGRKVAEGQKPDGNQGSGNENQGSENGNQGSGSGNQGSGNGNQGSENGNQGSGKNPFRDVAGHWALSGIQYVWSQGLMNGTSSTTFAPDAPLSRAMLVQILYNLEGKPGSSSVVLSEITDVPADAWYRRAVAWALETGIVQGSGQNTFLPDQPITREQTATILYRYAKERGYDTNVSQDLIFGYFYDGSQISSYARQAMLWAVEHQLITGGSDGRISPQNGATRAQIATVLTRFCENIMP